MLRVSLHLATTDKLFSQSPMTLQCFSTSRLIVIELPICSIQPSKSPHKSSLYLQVQWSEWVILYDSHKMQSLCFYLTTMKACSETVNIYDELLEHWEHSTIKLITMTLFFFGKTYGNLRGWWPGRWILTAMRYSTEISVVENLKGLILGTDTSQSYLARVNLTFE